jgi:hypothetical protein
VGRSIDQLYTSLEKGYLKPEICFRLEMERYVHGGFFAVNVRSGVEPTIKRSSHRLTERNEISYQERKMPTDVPQEMAYHLPGGTRFRSGVCIACLLGPPLGWRKEI